MLSNVKLTFTTEGIHANKSLERGNLGPYPQAMPFIVYGHGQSRNIRIAHALSSSPNAQLVANNVRLEVGSQLDASKNYIVTLDHQLEWAMQPFTISEPPKFFSPCATFDVTVREEGKERSSGASSAVSRTGKLTLSANPADIFVDYQNLNEEIAVDIYVASLKESKRPDAENQADIDKIADFIVQQFQSGDMSWEDNVIHKLRRNLPLAKEYSVTLGAPDGGRVAQGRYFKVVSRFIREKMEPVAGIQVEGQREFVTMFREAKKGLDKSAGNSD